MKTIAIHISCFVTGVLLNMQLFSQIVINNSDMPVVGDTLRVSSTVIVPPGYAATAMDTTWNFAELEAMSQRVDTFVSVTSTPAAYLFFFVMLGGANLASPRNTAPIPGFPISDGFTFYKNSSSSYDDLGSAFMVQGAPLPAKYNVPDKYYKFPMSPDSSWSSMAIFEISLPDFAYLSIRKERENVVDGWGTLITPFGTFQTLRVRSTIFEHDSVFIDSVSQGISVDRNIIEYKWLAKGEGIPVLQITEESGLVTATYRDIYRMPAQGLTVSLGPDTAVFAGTVLNLMATVSGGTPPYQILWNTLDTGKTISITAQEDKLYSVWVIDATQNVGTAQKMVSIKYPPGIEEFGIQQFLVNPNPAIGLIKFKLPDSTGASELKIFSSLGNLVREVEIEEGIPFFSLDISDLPGGLYSLKLSSGSGIFSTKLIVPHSR